MAIESIRLGQALQQVGQLDNKIEKQGKEGAGAVADSMGTLISRAVEQLDASQKAADGNIAALVAGEPVDLHHVMLQMEESMLNLNLALQVRNKVIEAYQEVQRMQV